MRSWQRPLPLANQELVAVTNIFIAEYNSLRCEIGRLQDHQKQLVQFALLILVAPASALAALGSNRVLAQLLLLVLPILYATLGIMYSERTAKILVAADYIDRRLRPELVAVVGSNFKLWEWEDHRRHNALYNRGLLRLLDVARWLVFLLPAGSCLAAYGYLVRAQIPTLLNPTPARLFQLLLALIGFGLNLFVVWTALQFPECRGIPQRPSDESAARSRKLSPAT
jgi:hypothetical protein